LTPLTRSAYLPAVLSTAPDQGTILLYALSTLAQTCAALAAFVGAVGLFRLQLLRDQRKEAERELRVRSEGLVNRDVLRIPMDEILEGIESAERRGSEHPNLLGAKEARGRWERFVPRLTASRRALVVFELWNLGVIAVSLSGFNYISPWAGASQVIFWALWAIALVTAFITVGCVIVWTQGVEK